MVLARPLRILADAQKPYRKLLGEPNTVVQRRLYLHAIFSLWRQIFRTDRPRGCPAALKRGSPDRSSRFGSAHGRRGRRRGAQPSGAGTFYTCWRRRWPSDSKSAAGTQVSRLGRPASHPIRPIPVVPTNGQKGARRRCSAAIIERRLWSETDGSSGAFFLSCATVSWCVSATPLIRYEP